MENEQDYRHSCKYCKKKFICGRALGGHMRSHMTMPSTDADEKCQMRKVGNGGDEEVGGSESHKQGGYVLRENPKKSWRFSDSIRLATKDSSVCKDCGKVFPSLRALFGHMRSHSQGRSSQSLDEGSWREEQKQIHVLDGHSDNECGPKRRRSKRISRQTASSSVSGFSGVNSYSACDIEQEQEDVAISLMMLSRDIWKDTSRENLQGLSNDGSMSREFRSGLKRGADLENKKHVDADDRTTKDLRNGFSKSELDVADNGTSRIAFNESKKAKSGVHGGFHGGRNNAVSGSDFKKESEHECQEPGSEFSYLEMKKDYFKQGRLDSFGSEQSRNAHKDVRLDSSESSLRKQPFKQAGYECTTCNKVFHSYQALGGHRASHKKVKGCFSKIDYSENSSAENDVLLPDQDDAAMTENKLMIENGSTNDGTDMGSKKEKLYQCPTCLKVFTSGQALGGHKRSHLFPNGDPEFRDNGCRAIGIQQPIPVIADLLDLNLPASNDDEVNGHPGFKSLWDGDDQKQNAIGMEEQAQLAAENAIVSSKRADFHRIRPLPPPCLQV